MHAGGAGRELVREQGESAGEDGGPADALDHARRRRRAMGSWAVAQTAAPAAEGGEAGEVDAPPAQGVAEHPAPRAACSARPRLIELRIQARATGSAPSAAAVVGMVAIGET